MLWNVKSHRNKVAVVKYKFTLWDRTHTGRYEVTIINNKVSIRNTVKIVRYKVTLEDKSHNNDRQIHNWKILNHKFLHKFAIPRNKVDIANYTHICIYEITITKTNSQLWESQVVIKLQFLKNS